MKPELLLTPGPWVQLAADADLVVTWDASAVADFESLAVLIGTTAGDSDLGSAISVDSTDSVTVAAEDMPTSGGLIHLTAFLDCGAVGLYTYDRVVRPASWPPHTEEFAEIADQYALEAALGAISSEAFESIIGPNWLGLHHNDVAISEADIRSSGDPAQPTAWGRWQIRYPPEKQLACFDGGEIVTEGWVDLVVMQEDGSSTTLGKAAIALCRVALKNFQRAGADYTFETGAPTEINRDPQLGAWVAVILAVPFKGL